jgi:hypothetical protein
MHVASLGHRCGQRAAPRSIPDDQDNPRVLEACFVDLGGLRPRPKQDRRFGVVRDSPRLGRASQLRGEKHLERSGSGLIPLPRQMR